MRAGYFEQYVTDFFYRESGTSNVWMTFKLIKLDDVLVGL